MLGQYIEIGPVPYEEDCAGVGQDGYAKQARKECNAFIRQIQRAYPEAENAGCSFFVKSNNHDFGTYYEVAVRYHDKESSEAAYAIEGDDNNLLQHWDDEARAELGLV